MAAYTAALFGMVFGWVARLDAKATERKSRYPEGEDTSL
jgi:hypothetical protein